MPWCNPLRSLAALLLAAIAGLRARACRRRAAHAATCISHRRNLLRPGLRVRRRVRRHHQQRLRVDAGLRLPRAAGQAGPAHARGDADRRRAGLGVHLQAAQGHLLLPRPGLQGQAARADRGRLCLLDPAHPRSCREIGVAVAVRGQDRRRRRGARGGNQDGQVRLRQADRRPRGRRPLHAAHPLEGARPALSVRGRRAEHRRGRARSGRGLRRRHRRTPGRNGARTCSATTGAARASSCSPIPASATSPMCRRGRCLRRRSRWRPRSRAAGCR